MKILLSVLAMSAALLAGSVTFKGGKVDLNGDGLQVGADAPVFYAVSKDLAEVKVGGKSDKVQIIAFVPSLDTGVCALETIAFENKISEMKNVDLFVVSKDLPFALGRFCTGNGIKNVTTLSDYKDVNNAKRYGATISSPAVLEGLFGRMVYIVNTDGKVAYKQIVSEIATEPDYDAIIKALKKIK